LPNGGNFSAYLKFSLIFDEFENVRNVRLYVVY